MSAIIWKSQLPSQPLHRWFEAFEANADAAMDALLLGRFDMANLSTVDVDDLLSRWTLTIAEVGDFAARLDSALDRWIAKNWGRTELTTVDHLRGIWARVGHALSATYIPMSGWQYLGRSAGSLREQMFFQRSFARHLFSPRGTDAFHACLNAVALYQNDDKLRTFWWALVELPHGFPIRYGGLALTGIRRLRFPHGGFRYDVARAVIILAKSLSRLVREGLTEPAVAKNEFEYFYRRTRDYFPGYDAPWGAVFSTIWREELRAECSDEIRAFLDEEAVGLIPRARDQARQAARYPGGQTRPRSLQLTWDAARDPARIEHLLLAHDRDAIPEAEWLLDEQHTYGLKSGNFTFLIRSLHRFATAARNAARRDSDLWQAQQWATEVTRRDPNDPRPWNLVVDILKRRDLAAGGRDRSWRLAWALIDRFPADSYARNGLAEVLKAQGRLREAEEVYRQATEDFPHDLVSRNGLAEVLRAQGRLYEASEIYRRAAEDFPHSFVTRNGFANVLARRAIAEPSPREALAQEARSQFSFIVSAPAVPIKDKLIALCTWALLEEKLGHLPQAADQYSAALAIDRNDPYAQDGYARVRQRLGMPHADASQGNIEEADAESFAHFFDDPTEAQTPEVVSWASYFGEDANVVTQIGSASEQDIPFEASSMEPSRSISGEADTLASVPWSILGYRLRFARAAFFRRSARYQAELPQGERAIQPETLRAAARKLLNEVAALRPDDSRAHAELIALDLEEHSASSQRLALGELEAPSIELLQVAAFAARRQSREEHHSLHDPTKREAVFRPVRALRDFDSAAAPLVALEEGLAALSMVDSAERLELSTRALERFRVWIRPRAIRVSQVIASGDRDDAEAIIPTEAWAHSIAEGFFKPCEVPIDREAAMSIEDTARVDVWLQSKRNESHLADLELNLARFLTPAIEDTLALV